METTTVTVDQFSGDALAWLKLVFVAQLALGVVLIVVLVAIAVVVFWRAS